MPDQNIPGVYIEETSFMSNSIVPVPTYIPVFIGYTEKAFYQHRDCTQKLQKVESFNEFKTIFGNAPEIRFADTAGGIRPQSVLYRTYAGVKWFFQHKQTACYILSLGSYDYDLETLADITPFTDALKVLEKASELTLVVIPDAINLKVDVPDNDLGKAYQSCYRLQSKMIDHCGKMKDRFAILDVPGGFSPEDQFAPVKAFRKGISPIDPAHLRFAAAYYPYLVTGVLEEDDFAGNGLFSTYDRSKKQAVLEYLNLMPPGAGIAGVYAQTDSINGVWKAPANVKMFNVKNPAIVINDIDQHDLNVSGDGKSICAIREFAHAGTLVWGARTLAGNDNEWKYVPVRRTCIFIEQSVKQGLKPFVFEPNDANTWASVKSVVDNFLYNLWREGAFPGAKTSEAYAVQVGLGTTMTAQDVLNGIMRVQLAIALIRPAEFIILTLEEKMVS